MLTFFRRVRKGLLQGGSTSKYLLYAIGEIALVVIGILLALQINNWNQDQKNRKEEAYYLKELSLDFLTNRNVLEDGEQGIKLVLGNIANTLLYMNRPIPDSINTYSLIRGYYGLSVPELEFAEGALNELLSTGKLSLIRNRQLRRDLADWNTKVEVANIHIAKILKFKEEELRPYMIECCPRGDQYRNAHLKVFEDVKFQTILELYELMLDVQMNLKRDPIKELLESILKQIDVDNNQKS